MSPATAYVGQSDRVLVHVIFATVVGDNRENIWGDLVYGRERVLDRPNQSEHLKCVAFESVRLGPQRSVIMYKPEASPSPRFTSDQVAAAKMLQELVFRPSGVGRDTNAPLVAHLWPNAVCRNFLLAAYKSCEKE